MSIHQMIADELKTSDFSEVWVSSRAWNALKASLEGRAESVLEEVDDEYAIPLITCGRKVRVFCDPTLEDGTITTGDEEESEEI